MQESVFHQVPQPVKVTVILAGLLAVSAGWYHDHHICRFGLGYEGVAVVTFVRQQVLGIQPFDQG